MAEILSYLCPFCDSEVRVGEACPGCAKKAKKQTPKPRSWQQDPASEGLNLPDEDFNYDDFVTREFGEPPHQGLGLKWYWWLLGIIVLGGMVAGIFWQ